MDALTSKATISNPLPAGSRRWNNPYGSLRFVLINQNVKSFIWLLLIIMFSSLGLIFCISPYLVSAQEPINIPDPNLERVIRAENTIHGKQAITTPHITQADLESITNLSGNGENISDLSGLEYCINLEVLILGYNDIDDLTSLKNLVGLKHIGLSYNQIEDISVLAELRNLEVLLLSDNNISDISILANMTKLRELDLSRNNVSDISALTGLEDLHLLFLSNNKISDITLLMNNPNIFNLDVLDLANNPLNDQAYDKHLTYLKDRIRLVFYDEREPIMPLYWWWIIGVVVIGVIIFMVSLCKRLK